MPPVSILVFCTTEYGGRTFAPGVHVVTAAEAHSFYVNGWARPATAAEIAESGARSAERTGPIETAVVSSTGEAAVVTRTRAPRARPALSPQPSALS